MNEVTQIHLGRTAFTVSVDAQKELRDYLDAIKEQVGHANADVLEEVELRMAELLTERGITGDKVMLPADVQYLKEQLGEPHDFKEENGDAAEKDQTDGTTARRLFRDTDNAMIAGVAAGLGRYLNIDPVIVRLIFVALTLVGASGILLYILLWLLVPEAKTTSDRLSMQGKPATIDNLKQVVERADVPGAARRGGSALARILAVAGTIVLFAVGLSLAIGSGLAMLGTAAFGAYFLLDGFKVAGHVVAPTGGHEVVGFIAGVITLLTILLAMMLVGIAMIRRRWQLPAWGVAALLGIFFLSAAVAGALAADVEPAVRHRVEALEHTRTVQLTAFKSVAMNGPETDFRYIPDGQMYVRYHYFGSIHTDKLHNSVKNGTLTVDTNGADPYVCNSFCVGVDPGVSVEVHGPKLATVTINGKPVDMWGPCKYMDSDGRVVVGCPDVRSDPVLRPLPMPVPPNGNL